MPTSKNQPPSTLFLNFLLPKSNHSLKIHRQKKGRKTLFLASRSSLYPFFFGWGEDGSNQKPYHIVDSKDHHDIRVLLVFLWEGK